MYIVYGKDGLPACVGSGCEVAKYLDMTIGSFHSAVRKIKNDKRKAIRKGYKVYRV